MPKADSIAVSIDELLLSPAICGADQTATPVPRLRSEKQQEDAVARLFDAVRKEAKLHPLSRIEDRVSNTES